MAMTRVLVVTAAGVAGTVGQHHNHLPNALGHRHVAVVEGGLVSPPRPLPPPAVAAADDVQLVAGPGQRPGNSSPGPPQVRWLLLGACGIMLSIKKVAALSVTEAVRSAEGHWWPPVESPSRRSCRRLPGTSRWARPHRRGSCPGGRRSRARRYSGASSPQLGVPRSRWYDRVYWGLTSK